MPRLRLTCKERVRLRRYHEHGRWIEEPDGTDNFLERNGFVGFSRSRLGVTDDTCVTITDKGIKCCEQKGYIDVDELIGS